MTARYAQSTQVAADRSRSEIERTLTRYGADSFAYGWEADAAMIAFRAHGRFIRFEISMPPRSDFARTPTGLSRQGSSIDTAWEQGKRQRWRAASLWIKATLEAIESGFVSFEDAFLAHTVMPDGQRFGAYVAPQLEAAYASGKMPQQLLRGGSS